MKHLIRIVIVQFVCWGSLDAANLLGIFPMPGRSHYILADKLMKGLAAAGHHVTMITPFATKNLAANMSWDDIVLDGLADVYLSKLKEVNLLEDSKRSAIERTISYQNLMVNWVNATLYHPKVRALLKADTKFDAVIMEEFYNSAHKYFAHHFDCQLILMSSLGPNPWVNDIVANPSPPSYIPHFFDKGDFDYTNFWHRLFNLQNYLSEWIAASLYMNPLQNRMLQRAFPGVPPVAEYNERVSLVLLSSHSSLQQSVPLVPNMVEIGGYHIDPPGELPANLRSFLDKASDGAIYFSMGSNIKSKDLPIAKKRALFGAFERLRPIKVLWKYEKENDPEMPDNVLVKSWMPQTDILAHPNVKLFMTHGGFLSITETVYHGVPILAIPVFADQFLNAKKALRYGYGLQLPYNDANFTENALYDRILELLTDPKYLENARKRSRLFHDRPLKPLESLVFWVEYAIRHKGAENLQVDGAKLPFYKYVMLDVFLFLAAVLVAVLYLLKIVLKLVLSNIKSNKKEKMY